MCETMNNLVEYGYGDYEVWVTIGDSIYALTGGMHVNYVVMLKCENYKKYEIEMKIKKEDG